MHLCALSNVAALAGYYLEYRLHNRAHIFSFFLSPRFLLVLMYYYARYNSMAHVLNAWPTGLWTGGIAQVFMRT